MSTYGDYQQFNQAMTQEQIDEQRAFNSAAQFFDKTNSLGHQPYANQLAQQIGNSDYIDKGVYQVPDGDDIRPRPSPQFDSEAHRAFMRGLG